MQIEIPIVESLRLKQIEKSKSRSDKVHFQSTDILSQLSKSEQESESEGMGSIADFRLCFCFYPLKTSHFLVFLPLNSVTPLPLCYAISRFGIS